MGLELDARKSDGEEGPLPARHLPAEERKAVDTGEEELVDVPCPPLRRQRIPSLPTGRGPGFVG